MRKLPVLLLLLTSNIALAQYLPANSNKNKNQIQQQPQSVAPVTNQQSTVQQNTTTPELCRKPKPCDKCQPDRLIYEQVCQLNKLSEVNQVIDWWGKQPSKTGKGTLLNDWNKMGIKDPYSNKDLIRQAQNLIDEANKKMESALKANNQVDVKIYKPWIVDSVQSIASAIDAQIAQQVEADRKNHQPINPLIMVLETKGKVTTIKPPPGFDMKKFTQPPIVTKPNN